ncbi:MAG: hypothetical protein Fur0037_21110 [Planctomycetota bacterium]
MTSPLRFLLWRFLSGSGVLLASAAGWPSSLLGANPFREGVWFVDLPLGMLGFLIAMRATGPLVRILYEEQGLRAAAGKEPMEGFDEASLPRRIYLLLLAVARADGIAGPKETKFVRRFVAARFPGISSSATRDPECWTARDIAALAARIALSIDPLERATLFTWACRTAFIDGGFHPEEHAILQQVARGLGLSPAHARTLFHLAKERHRLAHAARREGGERRAPSRGHAAPSRRRALDILGLDESATREDIRRRHRELVKRFHPDAHPNLGPLAREEASERFRAIQRAYEILND